MTLPSLPKIAEPLTSDAMRRRVLELLAALNGKAKR
jgi:hypothetical protein